MDLEHPDENGSGKRDRKDDHDDQEPPIGPAHLRGDKGPVH